MNRIRFGWIAVGVLAAALVLLVVLVYPRYRMEIRLAQDRIDALGSRVVQTDCGPIEYARTGTGDPVLVVHGSGGGFDQGLGLARGFIGEGYQIIAPSRFGYLGSPEPAGAAPALQADAFACLLDFLGIRQAAVFSTSAGVTSAVQFALRHPDRVSALVLHSPNAPGEVGLLPPPRPVFKTLVHSDFAFWALTTYFRKSLQPLVGVPKGFVLTPETEADVQAAMASVLPVSPRADGILFDTYVSNPEINTYPLGEVKALTLVVSAVDDPEALHTGARLLASQIPNARLVAVPDGGHLMLGHTEEVKTEVTRFLRLASAQAVEIR